MPKSGPNSNVEGKKPVDVELAVSCAPNLSKTSEDPDPKANTAESKGKNWSSSDYAQTNLLKDWMKRRSPPPWARVTSAESAGVDNISVY